MVDELQAKRRKALKRAEDAEQKALVLDNESEAKVAQRTELLAYMTYLESETELSERQRLFLCDLAVHGLPSRSCLNTSVPARTYYEWITRYPTFKTLVEETKKMSNDRLEQVAIDLATGAYMRPLVSQGRIAAYERIYDSKVLIAMLKARKPAEFAQRIDVTSNGHSLVKLIDKDAWDSV